MPPVDTRGILEIPLHRFLGVALLDEADPYAGICFPVTANAQNNVGILHGGVVAALLDVASYLALLPELEPGQSAVTHDMTVSLLRAVAAGSRVELRGTVLRRGRTLAFLRAEATVDGGAVAVAQVTKSILTAR